MGFLGVSVGKESACNAGYLGSVHEWEHPLEKGIVKHSSILPGESHGQRSLVGYSPQGRKESDTTEVTEHTRIMRNWLV